MRLINADTIVHWQTYDDETESHPEHTGTIAELLDQITDEGCPEIVDGVPVVRCRECMHWKPINGINLGFCCYNSVHKCTMFDEDFCSHGKRKDGEQHEHID